MLFLLFLAALASDPEPSVALPPRPSVITMPDWLAKPSAADLGKFYPRAASQKGLDGRATIKCVVNAEGLLMDCTPTFEDPAGEGFGGAAVAMASKFKMRPMTKDGQPAAGGTVRIPMRFQLPPGATVFVEPQNGWEMLEDLLAWAKFYPPASLSEGIAGKVVVECVGGRGKKRAICTVVSEAPSDRGFGRAALDLQSKLLTKPPPGGASQTGNVLRMTVRFKPPWRPVPSS